MEACRWEVVTAECSAKGMVERNIGGDPNCHSDSFARGAGVGWARRTQKNAVWGKETRFTLATRNGGRSVAPTLRVC